MNVSKRGFRGFVKYLEHLAGDRSMNLKYASAPTTWLRSHINDDVIEALTSGQYDRLERTISSVLGSLRVNILVRQGWTMREWRPTNARQPGVKKCGYFFDWRHDIHGWRDHPYRLTHVDENGVKREWFVSEPYGLEEDGLRALVTLMDEGWRVRVDAEWALHYPGSTLRVTISKREER